MKPARSDQDRLEHIVDAANTVLQQYAALPEGKLPDGDFRFFAFVKCVEIIGEAAYCLSREFRKEHPDVEWTKIIRLRHILVHDYDTIDDKALFYIIQVHVPVLRDWVADYLTNLPNA